MSSSSHSLFDPAGPSHSPSPRANPKKSKSKSLSLPPFPRSLALASPSSPSKRRYSSRGDSPSTIPPSVSTQMLSPSKLPATDSMSYFPPFEDMGSNATSSLDGDVDRSCEAGPSRRPSPCREGAGPHGKNRSLGSLANFMAWATFSPSSENPPSRPAFSASISTGMIPSAPGLTDGERLEALSRRFTSGQGKRRVLEAMAMQEGVKGVSLLGLTTTRMEVETEGVKQKRRVRSEMDVERILRAGKEEVTGEDEEGDVERMIGWIPRPRIQRQHLSLPPPPSGHLPNWRFPIPSPPITSLSPHIPLEFFQFEISNPASTSSSPTKQTCTFSDLHDQELEEIEGSLLSLDSGSSSVSSTDSPLSNPTTPNRSPPRKTPYYADPRFWDPTPGSSLANRKAKSRFRVEGDDEDEEGRVERMEMILPEKIKLRRTSSSGSKASCDSNATIKVREGEITPRLGKGWRAAQTG